VPNARQRAHDYPHQFSGGMAQRAVIAMAISCGPKLLIADEATTALDATVQAQILALLDDLRRDLGMAMMVISHDLGVIAATCENAQVMYAGRIVERASAAALYSRPRHPYTTGLLASSPRLGNKRAVLPTIPGVVPSPGQRGSGCYFNARCPRAVDRCRVATPPLAQLKPDHDAACWNPVP
jgi:oligopeptide/dipeptide ABC transporter ATP-binding protein